MWLQLQGSWILVNFTERTQDMGNDTFVGILTMAALLCLLAF